MYLGEIATNARNDAGHYSPQRRWYPPWAARGRRARSQAIRGWGFDVYPPTPEIL